MNAENSVSLSDWFTEGFDPWQQPVDAEMDADADADADEVDLDDADAVADTDTDVVPFENDFYCWDYEAPPPLPWFKRYDHEDTFMKQIDEADNAPPPSKRLKPSSRSDIQALAKSALISFLRDNWSYKMFQKDFQYRASTVDDYAIFRSAVRAAAAMVYLVLSEDLLVGRDPSPTLDQQLNQLWNIFAEMGNKGCPIEEVVKSIVHHDVLKPYSLVTECHVNDMLREYLYRLRYPFRSFDSGYKVSSNAKQKAEEKQDKLKEQDPISVQLNEAVSYMNLSPRLKVDGYTRLLMSFNGRTSCSGVFFEMLLAKVLKEVDTDALSKLNTLKAEEMDENIMHFLFGLQTTFIKRIKAQLAMAVRPFEDLALMQCVDYPVLRVIEVAELRRSALGSRFIKRKHLLWAYYECGYGLSQGITDNIKLNTFDEDHPPYHVYMAAIKLAKSDGKDYIGLDHFIFVVLYANEDIENQIVKYKDFLAEMESYKVMCPRRDRFTSPDGEVGHHGILERPFSLEIMKTRLNSLQHLTDNFSLMMEA